MKHVMLLVLSLTALFFTVNCGNKTPASKMDTVQGVVSDAKSGFCIMNNLPLYDLTAGVLKWKANCLLGEKLSLAGPSAKAVQGGKERDFVQVSRDSGATGWVRAEYLVPNSILAVITAEDAMIYSQPKNTAVTEQFIPKMTVIAIHKSSAAQAFIKASFVDPAGQTLQPEVFLRNDGISTRPDDTQTVILLQLAAQSKNLKQKEALLKSALKDYPASAFVTQVEEALAALTAPNSPGKPTEKFFATLVSKDDKVNVRSNPDETSGVVVAVLSKGQKVEVEEKTAQEYPIGTMKTPWYRIKEPAGWVYGGFLEEER